MILKRSIKDIWPGSKYVSATSFFNIFFFRGFLHLHTWINIWTFCFSSESVQLLCSRDVNHLLYIDHGNIKFSYIYTIEMRKSSLRKTSRWNAKLIYTVNKNNTKKQQKPGHDNKSFFSKRKNFIYHITKIFLLYTLIHIAFFNFLKFLWFEQISLIPSILWRSRLLLPKASASALYCFQICKKVARQFKILATLYFYRVIIIFKLTSQQVLLVVEWNEVRNFCPHLSGFSIPFTFENI